MTDQYFQILLTIKKKQSVTHVSHPTKVSLQFTRFYEFMIEIYKKLIRPTIIMRLFSWVVIIIVTIVLLLFTLLLLLHLLRS